MRILHTESSPNWGGQEMRIVEQAHWLNNNGHQAWIAARPGAAILEYAKKESIPVVEIPFRGNASPAAISRLWSFVRENKIDIVDCHSSRDATHCAFLRLLGCKVVRTLQLDGIKWGALHKAVWKYGNDYIVVVSDNLKSRLVDKGCSDQRISVVNEGIDLEEFSPQRSSAKLRSEFGLSPNARLIINIGMIRPDKGQKYFVRSAEAIAQKIPSAVFMIVGAGTKPEFEEELRTEIASSACADQFILTGYRGDIADCIAASDCVVVSSLLEAHSRVIPQAYAIKRPVVATAVGGIPDILQDHVTGRLVPARDATALANAVIETLSHDNQHQLDLAFEYAKKKFSFDTMMQNTLDAYRKCL